MKKNFLARIALISFSIFVLPLSVNAYAENDGIMQYPLSLYLENQLPKKQILLPTDDELFDRFLKYSLYVTDKNALTPDQLALCRTVFLTERSNPQLLLCQYVRQTIKTGVAPERILLDNQKLLSDMTGYSPIPFYPDVAYYDLYAAYDFGQPSEIDEYWLDDCGSERIIAADVKDTLIYQTTVNAETDIEEMDRLLDKFQGNGNFYEQKNGEYIFLAELNGYTINSNELEVYTSDIWKYVIKDDNTACIVDCTLPKGSNIDIINEPTVLPTELDGTPVSGIENNLCLSETGITKLIIPENYANINGLFMMAYLKEVVINSPNLRLDFMYFTDCPSLTTVTLNVKSVGQNCFYGCKNLEYVEVTGAEEISCNAFSNSPKLSHISLPEGLKYIGQGAFTDTALESLTIPKSVEIVGTFIHPFIKNGEIVDPLTANRIEIVDEDCIIQGYYDTEAHYYALNNNYTFVPLDELEYGDINLDGVFGISDLVTLQKYLICTPFNELSDWKSADITKDGKIDVFDLCMLKKLLLNNYK